LPSHIVLGSSLEDCSSPLAIKELRERDGQSPITNLILNCQRHSAELPARGTNPSISSSCPPPGPNSHSSHDRQPQILSRRWYLGKLVSRLRSFSHHFSLLELNVRKVWFQIYKSGDLDRVKTPITNIIITYNTSIWPVYDRQRKILKRII
jgi:hypothetical protein